MDYTDDTKYDGGGGATGYDGEQARANYRKGKGRGMERLLTSKLMEGSERSELVGDGRIKQRPRRSWSKKPDDCKVLAAP